MGILSLFSDTFDVMKNNLVIVLPIMLFTVFIALLVIGFALLLAPASQLASSVGYGAGVYGYPNSTAGPNITTPGILQNLPIILTGAIVLGLIILLLGVLINGMYIAIAEQGYKKQKISLGAAFDVAKRRFMSLLGAGVNCNLIALFTLGVAFLVGLWLAVVFGASPTAGTFWLAFIPIVILIIVAIGLIYVLFFQVYAVVILENRRALEAVQRSMDIGKPLWKTIIGILIVALIIIVIFSIIASLVGLGISYVAAPGTLARLLIARIVTEIIVSFAATWVALIPVFFYHSYVAKGAKMAKK